jgi:hypothetical protein
MNCDFCGKKTAFLEHLSHCSVCVDCFDEIEELEENSLFDDIKIESN